MFDSYFKKRRISKGFEIEDSLMTVTEKEKAMLEVPFERRGLAFSWLVAIVFFLILVGRVFYLDVVKGEYYKTMSRENRVRNIIIKAPRGNILDKFGHTLARNIPSIDAVIIPNYLPKTIEEKSRLAEKLSEVLDMNKGNIEIILSTQDNNSLEPVLLRENISQEQALIMAENINNFPGIILEGTAIRNYESSVIFSHIIGYDGKITREEMEKNKGSYYMTDYIGKSGLEKSYEQDLRGTYGFQQVEVDSMGRVKKNLGQTNPLPGNDLILNIDEGLQKKIYDSISQSLEKSQTKMAAAVAIDPRNGGILAMVSVPSYDNNFFARGITDSEYKGLIYDKNLPLFNRAVSGEYPPGSTVKPAIAAGALSEKTITPSTMIDGLGGALYIGNWRFRDWKPHTFSDVRKAIAESNDIFFYTIGGGYGNIQGLGMSRMKKYYNLFGFGEKTGIDLPIEASGFIPDEQWKLEKIKEKWYVGNSYHAAIGQGYVTATPLQLVNYTASLANGGTLYAPRIVNRVKNSDGSERQIKSEVVRKNFISKDILNVVKEGMRQTVTSGTAQSLKTLPVDVAGKTGTSQFGTENKTHSWFISFAPYDNPTIAMVVLVEGGGEGDSFAVPITKNVYEWYFGERKN